jgi:hypothetical protein
VAQGVHGKLRQLRAGKRAHDGLRIVDCSMCPLFVAEGNTQPVSACAWRISKIAADREGNGIVRGALSVLLRECANSRLDMLPTKPVTLF